MKYPIYSLRNSSHSRAGWRKAKIGEGAVPRTALRGAICIYTSTGIPEVSMTPKFHLQRLLTRIFSGIALLALVLPGSAQTSGTQTQDPPAAQQPEQKPDQKP